MLILGIDTAGHRTGTALLDGEEVLATRWSSGRHSALLVPMIAELFSSQQLPLDKLGLIGVAKGPGTYTGLRVGVVTAKALARSTGAVLLGIPTLDAMAAQAPRDGDQVLVALQAHKGRVLAARYVRSTEGRLELADAPAMVRADSLETPEPGTWVVTDGAHLIPGLEDDSPFVVFSDNSALSVGRLAFRGHRAGRQSETYSLTPEYLRPPAVTLKPGGLTVAAGTKREGTATR